MGHWKSALVALLLAVAGKAQATTAATAGIVVVTVKGEYDDVKERVVQAIEGRGLVINYTGQIAGMLERTGKDLGRVATVYSKAEVVEFCSARLSRDSMEAEPRNNVFCPYWIAVYALPKEAGKVYGLVKEIPGCSASFVSPNGLVVTNHHCLRGTVHQMSRRGETLLDSGFVARGIEDERRMPGYYAHQLLEALDVTAEMDQPLAAAADDAAREQARRTAAAGIQARL